MIATSGNVADVSQAHALLQGDDVAAMGDAGYNGVEKREENFGKDVARHVAMNDRLVRIDSAEKCRQRPLDSRTYRSPAITPHKKPPLACAKGGPHRYASRLA